MRYAINKVGFTGGEIGALLDDRYDTAVYDLACRTILNAIPTPQGPLTKRKGTHYVTGCRDNTKTSVIIPFIFSATDSYILEFAEGYIRFYTLQAQVLSGGVPYEIASPYQESDLYNIKFRQIGDIMYLAHPSYKPRKLSRLGATNWTLTEIDNLYGPVVDRPNGTTVTMQATGTITPGGSVTITASGAAFGTNGVGFETDHIGSVWAFAEASNSLSPYAEWTAGGSSTANAYYRYNGRLYQAGSTGTFGTLPPTHEDGTVSDGTINLTFANFGVGYAKMTARTSATVATFEVQRWLPPSIDTTSGIFVATTYWNEASWSGVRGWPRALAFHEQRLFFAGTNADPLTVYGSKSNRRFEDFDKSLAEDDAAIQYTLTGQTNTIQWLKSNGNFLLAGTFGGLAFIGSGSNADPLSPSNVVARVGTSYGCNYIDAVEVENAVQYVQRRGKSLYQAAYDDLSLNYTANDLTVTHPDILNAGVVQMAFQEEPYKILWLVDTQGQLIGLTQETNQKVIAWHRHRTNQRDDGTFDKVESVAVIPSTTGLGDEVWLTVRRTVNGSTVRYMEYIEPNPSKDYYVDAGIEYTGSDTTTITGASHLENEDIAVLADGNEQTVSPAAGGIVTLNTAAGDVDVGFRVTTDIEPTTPNLVLKSGPTHAQPKRIHELGLGLYKTLGMKVGRDYSSLFDVTFNTVSGSLGVAIPTFATTRPEDKRFMFDGTWDDATLVLRHDQPYPMTLTSINYFMESNDK